jgi:hypothetical protein
MAQDGNNTISTKPKKKARKRNDELLKDPPLYTDKADINIMKESNKTFYEKTTKKAFITAFKEEQERLNELVATEYYPSEKKKEVSDIELIKNYLNIVV